MIEMLQFTLRNPQETAKIAASLALSLYRKNTTILLQGELGAGKTTFTQGFAHAIGISTLIPSPTFTLCNEYPNVRHIDLYRLQETEAKKFIQQLEDRNCFTIIEWPERAPELFSEPGIFVHLQPTIQEKSQREIRIEFRDIAIPEEQKIKEWIKEVSLPAHIQRHAETVAMVAGILANDCISRGIIVRKNALIAAAKLHDLLRFVDFKSFDDDRYVQPTKEQKRIWSMLKERYGTPHETAAERFLIERGFSEIGSIIATHGAKEGLPSPLPLTTEQKLLAYSDKRVTFEKIVSLEERFSDIEKRYGSDEHNAASKKFFQQWHAAMKTIEQELYPTGTPKL